MLPFIKSTGLRICLSGSPTNATASVAIPDFSDVSKVAYFMRHVYHEGMTLESPKLSVDLQEKVDLLYCYAFFIARSASNLATTPGALAVLASSLSSPLDDKDDERLQDHTHPDKVFSIEMNTLGLYTFSARGFGLFAKGITEYTAISERAVRCFAKSAGSKVYSNDFTVLANAMSEYVREGSHAVLSDHQAISTSIVEGAGLATIDSAKKALNLA